MDKNPLFQEIAESIRQDILFGNIGAGDELPTVRAAAKKYKCAPGTIQRAYHELIQQGLLYARPGQRTKVTKAHEQIKNSPLQKASLIHEIESFLLSQIKTGHSPEEIEQAFQIAMDRWRTISEQKDECSEKMLRFVGSHDLAVSLMNQQLEQQDAELCLKIKYAGSLGGLIALTRGEADLAGCHLYDEETGDYNVPFIRKLLPGRRIALITLTYRKLGLIICKNNPKQIMGLSDLGRKDLQFINRQPGAGTRVWLDMQLQNLRTSPQDILGYDDYVLTHSEAASAVASKKADLALGIESAALAYNLDFIPLTTEHYEFVVPQELFKHPTIQLIQRTLTSKIFRNILLAAGGYETENSGDVRWMK